MSDAYSALEGRAKRLNKERSVLYDLLIRTIKFHARDEKALVKARDRLRVFSMELDYVKKLLRDSRFNNI